MLDAVLFEHAPRIVSSKQKIRYILQSIFNKCEDVSQATEHVYSLETVTTKHAQFWFRRYLFVLYANELEIT